MSAYTIRIDSETKNQFDLLCERLGLSVSTAVNLFIRKSIREQAIPFRIDLNSSHQIVEEAQQAIEEMRASSKKRGLSDMTLEEINEEIALSRKKK
ncbi:MAG: type II toxin-antitoxin system RelB/DinJ family antitoxin [Bacteroidales bacterium]|nr:type II toxin-antitoxin system RelB/DinJ family antitoxin [Bacteroidales bacterium]